MQGLRAGLSGGNVHVQQLTAVLVRTAAQLFYAGDLDPEASHFFLHSELHLSQDLTKVTDSVSSRAHIPAPASSSFSS